MALSKTLTAENGVTTAYHKIGAVYLDRMGGYVNFQVYSYVSKDLREADKPAIQPPKSFMFARTQEEYTLAELYDYLKTTEDFVDAVDD